MILVAISPAGGECGEWRVENARDQDWRASPPLHDLAHSMPVVRELWEAIGLRVIDRFLAQRGEANPALASGAAARESGPLPPGSDQGLVDPFRIAVQLQLEIDPFHRLIAPVMR